MASSSHRRPPWRALVLLVASARCTLAHACTVCGSPNGHAVRAGLFNGHFLHTFVLVLLPFPILAVTVLLLGRVLPDLVPANPACSIPLAPGSASFRTSFPELLP